MKVALTHDIDRITKTYQYLTNSLRAVRKSDMGRLAYEVASLGKAKEIYWGFDEIVRIEEKYNVKSTFYFLNETIPFNLFSRRNWMLSLGRYSIHDKRIVNVIRELDKGGWEIGVHGSYHSFENKALLKMEKRTLEEILGKPIRGTRQHYLNMNDETWRYQADLGFNYDTTYGHTREIGYLNNKVKPFKPLEEYPDFVVFPLTIMDFNFINHPNRWQTLDTIIEQAEREKGVIVINWHNNYFDAKEYPGYPETYEALVKTLLEKGATVKTLLEFYTETISS